MLKSRRGLLAAGLAVAVVGALGVVSTLSAGAEQISGDPAAQARVAEQADAADVDAGISTPPATLPWGGKPQPVRMGRPGASSKELAAKGLQAAADIHKGRVNYAPKGLVTRDGFLATQDARIKPPSPAPSPSGTTASPATTSPATTSAVTSAATAATATGQTATTAPTTPGPSPSTTGPSPAAAQALAATSPTDTPTSTGPVGTGGEDGKTHFFYNTGAETAVADGLFAGIQIKKPLLGAKDYHTLAELSVQSADKQQTIEVGWNVDRDVNQDEQVHLFVYHWINGVPTCYNACGGFVQYPGGFAPGVTIPVTDLGKFKNFGISHVNGAWWISYDTSFVGYFPDKLWTSQGVDFTRGGYFQLWGEVASPSVCPAGTQMGSGDYPPTVAPADGKISAAAIGNATYVNGPSTANLSWLPTTSLYRMHPFFIKQDNAPDKDSTKSFYYGGPAPTWDENTKTCTAG